MRAISTISRAARMLLSAPSRVRESVPALQPTPMLLDAVEDAADAEQAARYLHVFFARVGQPGVYVRLLGADPSAVRRLVATLGASAFIGEAVESAEPGARRSRALRGIRFLDGPLTWRAEEVNDAVREAPASAEDADEPLVRALRRAKARVTIEVGLADLAGEISTRDATLILSALADASLEVATRHALGTPENEPVRGLTVLAMGKLGGREIGYGSDLDRRVLVRSRGQRRLA